VAQNPLGSADRRGAIDLSDSTLVFQAATRPAAAARWLLVALSLLAGLAAPAAAAELRSGWYAGEPQQFLQRRQGREALTGLDIEMVRGIAARAGHEVSFTSVTFPALMQQVARGEMDLVTGTVDSPARRATARFTRAYRADTNVLITRRDESQRMPAADAAALVAALRADPGYRLGFRTGFSYVDPALDALLADPQQASRLRPAPTDAENLRRLLAGQIDGFLAERLSVALLIQQSGALAAVEEAELRLHVPLHLMFGTHVSEATVQAFDRAIEALEREGRLAAIAARFRAPVLLSLTLGSDWLFVIEVLGIAAGALAGYLAARQAQFSLFGGLVLATLGALGGGVVRDLLVNREPIAIVANPLYLQVVFVTVAVAYAVDRLGAGLGGRVPLPTAFSQGLDWLRRRDVHNLLFEAVDAVALGLFVATGVSIAVGLGVTPLWLWGPILGTLTGAGGAILRDVVRGGGVRNLRDGLYAEVALVWSMALSLYLLWRSHVIEDEEMLAVVVVAIVGAAVTRMAVVVFGWGPVRLAGGAYAP
jgi:polar amino acid transport system substrate-binding protein